MPNTTKVIQPNTLLRVIRPEIVRVEFFAKDRPNAYQLAVWLNRRGKGRAKSAGRQLFTFVSIMHALSDLLNAKVQYESDVYYGILDDGETLEFRIESIRLVLTPKES